MVDKSVLAIREQLERFSVNRRPSSKKSPKASLETSRFAIGQNLTTLLQALLPTPTSPMPRPNLRQGLDRDVYAVITKIEESNECTIKTITQGYDAIKRSNSHLSRQKRRPLEDSIDRVLQFRREELHDSEDSEAAIEEAEAQLPTKPEDERFLLNRQLTKHWHTKPAEMTPKATSTTPTPDEPRPKKKRRVQEDGDDKQSGSEKVKANGTKEEVEEKEKSTAPRKPNRPTRFSVEGPSDPLPLGGIASLQEDLRCSLKSALFKPIGTLQGRKGKSILLTGPRGVGKRTLVRSLAGTLGVPVVSIKSCFKDPERLEKSLTEAFDEATRLAPCLILVENLERYMSRHGSTVHNEHHENAVATFLQQLEKLFRELSPDTHISILGTSAIPTDIHADLCLGNIFTRTIQIRVPNLEARKDILRVLGGDSIRLNESNLQDLAKMTHGYVAMDLDNILTRAVDLRCKREVVKDEANGAFDTPMEDEEDSEVRLMPVEINVTFDDIKDALHDYVPSLRKEGFTEIPKKTWDNIGAMVEARRQLHKAIVGPIKNPKMFEGWDLGDSAGVILWGPPGCGKTLIAQAVANEAQASFILVNGPELLNKYVGESEKAVRELFQRARSSTPCVLFFDEMDSLVPKRDNASSDAGVRVVNALLTEMDGVQDRTGIYIIGTTNRPDMIDPAMLRPGRLSVKVFVDLPTEDERVDILRTIFRNSHPKASKAAKKMVEAVARDKRCKGFSGADLYGLRQAAAHNGLDRCLAAGDESLPAEITAVDWEAALVEAKPSVRNPGEYADIKRKLDEED